MNEQTEQGPGDAEASRPIPNPKPEEIDRDGHGARPAEIEAAQSFVDVEPFEVVKVTEEVLAEVEPVALDPFIPEWEPVRAKPGSALRQEGFRPRIRHRGKEVDPAVVIGTDERRIYNNTAYPWGCVCRVVTSVGTGSGIIVGPRHVLTASHVVNWGVPGGVNGVVEVHRAGPTVRFTTAIRRAFAYTRVTGSVGWTELDEDYAVLETASTIGNWFGWLGIKTYDSRWDGDPYWANVGYPVDVGGTMWPTRQFSKWLDEHAFDFGGGRAMDTNADINPGNSGGPMFAWWDNGPHAVAVVSAHDVEDRENYCAGGSDLTRLVSVARAAS